MLARIARGVGSANIDHRLRQLDFGGQESEGAYPNLGMTIAAVEKLEGILVVGSNLRQEMPMLAHRVRKAAVKGGAKVSFVNPRRFDYLFPVAAYSVATDLVGELSAVVRAAAAAADQPVPHGVPDATVNDGHRAVAGAFAAGTRRAIFLGTLAQRHPAYAQLKAIAASLAQLTGATVGHLTEGPNAAGAYLAGAVPHREPGGAAAATVGLTARAMLESPRKAYVLFGGIDPTNDVGVGAGALAGAELVVAATTHLTASLKQVAHVVLPIGSFAESSGTFVNFEGRWQSWAGAARLLGDSRPGWKVLRVLANLLGLPGVDYVGSDEIRDALKQACGERAAAAGTGATSSVGGAAAGTGATSSAGGAAAGTGATSSAGGAAAAGTGATSSAGGAAAGGGATSTTGGGATSGGAPAHGPATLGGAADAAATAGSKATHDDVTTTKAATIGTAPSGGAPAGTEVSNGAVTSGSGEAGSTRGGATASGAAVTGTAAGNGGATGRWVDIPVYQGDVLVRGSEALGKTKDGHSARDVI